MTFYFYCLLFINKISKFLLLITLKIKATTVDSHSQVLKDV